MDRKLVLELVLVPNLQLHESGIQSSVWFSIILQLGECLTVTRYARPSVEKTTVEGSRLRPTAALLPIILGLPTTPMT